MGFRNPPKPVTLLSQLVADLLKMTSAAGAIFQVRPQDFDSAGVGFTGYVPGDGTGSVTVQGWSATKPVRSGVQVILQAMAAAGGASHLNLTPEAATLDVPLSVQGVAALTGMRGSASVTFDATGTATIAAYTLPAAPVAVLAQTAVGSRSCYVNNITANGFDVHLVDTTGAAVTSGETRTIRWVALV